MLVLSSEVSRRREAHVPGFGLTAMVTAGEHVAPLHVHERAQLTLVYAGRLTEISDDGRESLEAGEMLFTPAHTSHETIVQGLRANVLAIDVCSHIPVPRARIRLPFAAAGDLPERIREELLGCHVPLLGELVTQLLAIAIAAEERPRAAPAWIAGVIAILQHDYANACTLESLAARAGVSPSWLAHAFRHATGMTVGDYLRHVRTNAAAVALRESDAPIGAIALACGFSDQAHLSRVFRALRGMTPREWRRGERRVTRA